MIAFFATLFLIPGSHELATPGPVSIPLPGPDHIHLRWKSLRSSGYWEPPTLKLPFAGTYWVSAATKSKVRTIPAATFNQLVINDGLTMVQQYRKQYKQLNEPGRIVTSDYAKTMITVGPPEPIAPVELNLPVEFILRYPQLVQLNFRGQPIEGIQISLNGKPIGITNGAGQLPLPVLNFPAKLTATVVRAYPDPGTAPWEFFNASLTLPPLSNRQAALGNGQLPCHGLVCNHESKRFAMNAVEFETTINDAGQIDLPAELAGDIPTGQSLKVVVMWDPVSADSDWRAAGRLKFERAYCDEDVVYEQLANETPAR